MTSSAGDPGGEGAETSRISPKPSSKAAPAEASAAQASTSLVPHDSSSIVPQKRKRQIFRTNFDSVMCKIHVGLDDEKIIFPVHKKVFVGASAYFAAVFDGRFSESVSGVLRLPEEDPEVFAEVVKHVYRGTISIFDESTFLTGNNDVKIVSGLPLFFQLYVAFERYQLDWLLGEITSSWKAFIRSQEWEDGLWRTHLLGFGPEVATWVYANTTGASALRQITVKLIQHHLYHHNSYKEAWQECFEETSEIAVDLTRYLMKFVVKARCPNGAESDLGY